MPIVSAKNSIHVMKPSSHNLLYKYAMGTFICPIHRCGRCKGVENKAEYEMQFAICRGCPTAYHRECLPTSISYNGTSNDTGEQRAWDNLLHNRILMYCMKHDIVKKLATPRRDHLLFIPIGGT